MKTIRKGALPHYFFLSLTRTLHAYYGPPNWVSGNSMPWDVTIE
jgi:hypothetical protein